MCVFVCVREWGGSGGGHEVMRVVVESGKVATPCPSCLARCHVLPLPVLFLLFSRHIHPPRHYTHLKTEMLSLFVLFCGVSGTFS